LCRYGPVNMGAAAAVQLLVVEARKTAAGHMQLIAFARSDSPLVLHWAATAGAVLAVIQLNTY
jgi:hypothetical protein